MYAHMMDVTATAALTARFQDKESLELGELSNCFKINTCVCLGIEYIKSNVTYHDQNESMVRLPPVSEDGR